MAESLGRMHTIKRGNILLVDGQPKPKKGEKKTIKYLILLCMSGLILFGAFWQIEIAIINITHGYEFGIFFGLIRMNNWHALELMYAISALDLALAIIAAYKCGEVKT
jgi:hypothetical protein